MSLEVGDVVAEKTYHLTRDTLVRYAGASGDFNPIHYRDDFAQSVGASWSARPRHADHGVRRAAVVDWLGGDSGRVTDYQSKFTRPVPVDAAAGAEVSVVAKVGAIDDDGMRIDLTVTFDGATVLGKAQVRVTP